MLVCNVSLRPPRTAISAGLVEAASATAATAGYVALVTLVDEPTSALDDVDAYSGEIMLEAASADAAVDAGLAYGVAVVEAAAAAAALDGTVTGSGLYTGALVEAATAADSATAIIVGATTTFTTTGVIAAGPLFVMDATLSGSTLTVIDVGA